MSIGLNYIAAICRNGNTGELRRVDESYFVAGNETTVFRFCVLHVRRFGELPSSATVQERTSIELPEVTDSLEYYISALRERRFHNQIVPEYNALRVALSERNMMDAVSIIDRLASVSRLGNDAADLLSIREVSEIVLDRYDARHRIDGLVGVPIGFPTLDGESSGMQNGDLNVIVARPETGKTWILLRALRSALDYGANVLFVTMEMSMAQIGTRYAAMVAGVNPSHARRGKLGTYDENRFRQALDQAASSARLHIYQGNVKGSNVGGIDAVIAEQRPDFVIIDGVYMLRSARTNRGAPRNIQISDVLDDLKDVALRRDIPILASSQVSREGAKAGHTTLETVGFTDAFSTHCSVVYSLEYPHKTASDKRTRIIRTIKGREGESAQIAITFRFNPVCFEEIPIHYALSSREILNQNVNIDWMLED
jgi:hypothetical protein